MDKMRFSSKKERYSNGPVNHIRIFDPVLIGEGDSLNPNYEALAETDSHRSALLFEGHVEKVHDNEQVFLLYCRAPLDQKNRAST